MIVLKMLKLFLWLLLAGSIVAVGITGCADRTALIENERLNGSGAAQDGSSRNSSDNAGVVSGDPDEPVSSGDSAQKEPGLPQKVNEVVESSRETAGIKSIQAEARNGV